MKDYFNGKVCAYETTNNGRNQIKCWTIERINEVRILRSQTCLNLCGAGLLFLSDDLRA
jgi:hypothetical protein